MIGSNNIFVYRFDSDIKIGLSFYSVIDRFAYEPWSVLPKFYEHFPLTSASTQVTNKAEIMKETQKVKDKHLIATDDVGIVSILENSSHRDGAIYKVNWDEIYLMDIADRKESK